MPQRIFAYEGPGQKDLVALFYRSRLEAQGWREDGRYSNIAADRGRSSLRFTNASGNELVLDLEQKSSRVSLCVITS